MYNTTPYGVRRAHSFDSSDNLERWQAMRDHKKQFLSTRAKFDKVPPSEPPPPPPRQESKYRTSLSSSSSFSSASCKNDDFQNISEILQQTNIQLSMIDRGSEFSSSKYKYEPMKISPIKNCLTDRTNANSSQNEKKRSESINISQRSVNQKGHIELKQNWHRYRVSETGKADEVKLVSSPSVGKTYWKQENIIREPPAIKKVVNSFEVPTSYQVVDIKSGKSSNSENMSNDIDLVDSSSSSRIIDLNTETKYIEHETSDSYHLRRPSDYYKEKCEEQNLDKSSPRLAVTHKQDTTLALEEDMQQNGDYKTYLESSLKMFTDSLLNHSFKSNIHQTQPAEAEMRSSSINYDNNLVRSVKPRRVSTGSMHDPMIWRSHYSGTPVKTLVKKFSNTSSR